MAAPAAATLDGVTVTGASTAATPSERPAPATASAAATPAAPVPAPTAAPAAAPPEAPAAIATPRGIAAQVAPAIVHLAQRPAGTHQITLTVRPEATGPITVRAHIGQGGEVRIDLAGATEAGREALRAMVVDLRRDLAAVMPHAQLSLGAGTTDAHTGDRGGAFTDPQSQGRTGRPDDGRSSADPRPAPRAPATASHVVAGAGLDIVV